MSDPKSEYGWVMVGSTDYKEGDEHFDSLVSSKWEPCEVPKYCNCGYKFRRRRITAPEGMRIIGIDEIPDGYCRAFGTDGRWGDSTWNENKRTIRQLIAGDYSQMLAIATPIKREVKPEPNIFSAFGSCPKFHWGDQVRKVGGDYTFEGAVVSLFAKLSGKVRYVVEDDRGCLHIYSDKNLEATNGK